MDNKKLIHKERVLQPPKQLASRRVTKQASFQRHLTHVRPEFLEALLFQLVKNTGSGDLLWLAAHRAKDVSGATKEEVEQFLKVCRNMQRGLFQTPI